MNLKEYVQKYEKNIKTEKVFGLFLDNPSLSEKDVTNFIKTEKMNEDDFNSIVRELLSSFLGNGNWNKSKRPSVDSKELEMGIKVEMEHTNNLMVSQRIASDHLAEIADYYTRLKKMEDEAPKR